MQDGKHLFAIRMSSMAATLLLCVGSMGSAQAESAAATKDSAAPAAAAQAATDGAAAQTIATVNGAPITRTTLLLEMGARGQRITPQQALNDLINVEILRQEAERRGLDNRPEVVAEIARHRETVLASSLLREVIGSSKITDDELHSEYDAQVKVLPKTEYHVQHILVDSEKQAKSLAAEFAEGKSFADLARKQSKDASASNGGDIGWLSPKRLIPDLAGVVGKLKTGAVSAPVHTKLGWHLVRLMDKRAMKTPAFDAVRKTLLAAVAKRRAEEFLNKLRSKAEIETAAAAGI